MVLIGRIEKQGSSWTAECPIIGVYTFGDSRAEAADMLRDAIDVVIERDGFKAIVTEAGPHPDGGFVVHVSANEPTPLTAYLLRYQREIHKLTLDDVAAKLGVASRNAYARYEQGRTEPSLSKLLELLDAVAPELAMIIGPRQAPPAKRSLAKRARRSA